MGGENLGTKASPVRVVRMHVDADEVPGVGMHLTIQTAAAGSVTV